MTTGDRILKNSVFLASSQIAAKIINFALILVLTRFLGKDGFGLYSFSFAYVSIFYFLTHMGIGNLLTRDVAKQKDNAHEFISYSLPIVLILSFSFSLLVNTIPVILDWNYDERMLALFFSFYFIFEALGKYFLAVMQAFERMGYEAILFISNRILFLVSALYCWYTDRTLLTLVILFVVIQGLRAIFALILVLKNFTRFSLSWSLTRARALLKESYPFALVLLFSAVSSRIDLLMLKGYHSTESVAIYNTARKIIEALSFLPENIYTAVFPSLSLFFVSQKDKYNQTFKQFFIMILIIAIPISAGLFILAPRLIGLLFSPEFYQAYIPLRWLSIALLMIYIRMALSVTYNTSGNQHRFGIIFGTSVLINILLNLLLIPKYEALGASIALIISESSLILFSLPFALKHVSFSWGKVFFPKIFIITILISLFLYFVQELNIVIIILGLIIIYIALIIMLRVFSRSELKKYIEIFKRKSPI